MSGEEAYWRARCRVQLVVRTGLGHAVDELFLIEEGVVIGVHAPEEVGDAHLLDVGVLHELRQERHVQHPAPDSTDQTAEDSNRDPAKR